jgi:hypothetical protein
MKLLLSRLDEQQRRWYLAVESERLWAWGWPYSVRNHRRGRKDHPSGAGRVGKFSGGPPGRPGTVAGCWPAADKEKDLTLVATVQELVEPETAGDPMTGQIWVRSSLRSIRDRLVAVGHSVSPPTVGRLLKDLGYSLHVNSKKIEASSNHPDRDQQFAYIAVQRATFTAAGLPILSTDTKKKLRHEVARSEQTRRLEDRPIPDA